MRSLRPAVAFAASASALAVTGCHRSVPVIPAPVNYSATWNATGQSYYANRDYASAIYAYKNALSSNPPVGPASAEGSDANLRWKISYNYNVMANEQFSQNLLEAARGNYQSALDYAPGDPTITRNLNNTIARLNAPAPSMSEPTYAPPASYPPDSSTAFWRPPAVTEQPEHTYECLHCGRIVTLRGPMTREAGNGICFNDATRIHYEQHDWVVKQ